MGSIRGTEPFDQASVVSRDGKIHLLQAKPEDFAGKLRKVSTLTRCRRLGMWTSHNKTTLNDCFRASYPNND